MAQLPWEQTDDVLQQSLVTLHRTLANIQPPTVRDFLRSGGTTHSPHARTSSDITFGHTDMAQIISATTPPIPSTSAALLETLCAQGTPHELLEEAERWERLHAEIERLNDEEREIIELLWFHELTKPKRLKLPGFPSERCNVAWVQARLRLHAAMAKEMPGA